MVIQSVKENRIHCVGIVGSQDHKINYPQILRTLTYHCRFSQI